MSADALQRPLDAQANQINNLGTPAAATDATRVTTDVTKVKEIDTDTSLGTSFLAARADHVHATPQGIDLVLLQRNFRSLLRAFVTAGFDCPEDLVEEFEHSGD